MSLQYLSFLRNDSNNLSKQVTFYNFGNRSSHGNDCFWFLELFSIKYQAQSVHSYIISTPPGHLFGDWGNPRDTIQRTHANFADNHSTRILYRINFYCHWHLFFCHFFHLHSNWCPKSIIWGEHILPPNIHFVYHIVLLYLRYQLSLKKLGRTSSPGTIWSYLDVMIGREICFCAPQDFELLSHGCLGVAMAVELLHNEFCMRT